MGEKEDSIKAAIKRYGQRRRDRLIADSRMGLGRYALRLSLVLACLLVDLLGIPSAFQALGLLDAAFALPIVAAIAAAAVTQFALLYRMK